MLATVRRTLTTWPLAAALCALAPTGCDTSAPVNDAGAKPTNERSSANAADGDAKAPSGADAKRGGAKPRVDTSGLPTRVGGRVAGALAVSHGGVGSPPTMSDGPRAAARRAVDTMRESSRERPSLDGAIEGVVVLENDPRFNAGTGANIRLDGKTIQMDASLMTDDGAFAAVAVIERVKNPIRAVRHVLDSPHVLMAGAGATRFAHKMGLPDELPISADAEAKYKKRMARLTEAVGKPGSNTVDWRDYWNFPGEMPEEMKAWRKGGDTVGVVARDERGHFAAALSTGGTSVTLHGRVGDVPIYGAGLFAGPAGAVACTGHGEEIIRQALARGVYEAMADGTPASEAVAQAAAAFPEKSAVGLIAVDREGWGVAANREMAHGVADGTGADGQPRP